MKTISTGFFYEIGVLKIPMQIVKAMFDWVSIGHPKKKKKEKKVEKKKKEKKKKKKMEKREALKTTTRYFETGKGTTLYWT